MRMIDALNEGRTLILDGALATELERHGADLDHPLWSARVLLESPRLVSQVHTDYLESGADVITSASYQLSHDGMARCGYSKTDTDAALLRSVDLVRDAREQHQQKHARDITVAASIGPYGATLNDGSEYTGRYDISGRDLEDFHTRRLAVLDESAADVLAFETIPSIVELEILVAMLDKRAGHNAWISMSCKDAEHVSDGATIEACAHIADQCNRVIAFGVNCTAPMHIDGLLRRIAATTKKPMVVYPNSGKGYDAETGQWCDTGHSHDDQGGLPALGMVGEWQSLGARLIGGCCRTTPAWIGSVSQALTPGKKMSAK